MRIYTIYKATNIVNNKIYIGFDSNWPTRVGCHDRESRNPNHSNYNTYFHNAIKKHGWDNFIWEPLYQSFERDHTLNVMEPYFIIEYKSNEREFGYNLTRGGEGTFGYKFSESAKKEMSKRRSGPNSWIYNHTIYTFRHKNGQTFIGTVNELIKLNEEFKNNQNNFYYLVKGKFTCIKGWQLVDGDGNTKDRPVYSGKDSGNYDPTVYRLKHPEHGIFVGTRNDWKVKYNFYKGCVREIRINHSCHGWQWVDKNDNPIIQLKEHDNSGSKNPRYNHTIYTFKHKDGRIFIGTCFEFKKEFNASSLILRKLEQDNTYRGWNLM